MGFLELRRPQGWGARAAEPGSHSGGARAWIPPAPGPRLCRRLPSPRLRVLSPAGSRRLAKPGAPQRKRKSRRETGGREGMGERGRGSSAGMEGPLAPPPAVTSWPLSAAALRPPALRWERGRKHLPRPRGPAGKGVAGPPPPQASLPWQVASSGGALGRCRLPAGISWTSLLGGACSGVIS